MRRVIIATGVAFLVVLVLATAGCLSTPNAGNTTKSTVSSIYVPGQAVTNPPTPTPKFVTEVTPYETVRSTVVEAVPTEGYSVFPIPSPVPEDLTCLIYTKKQKYTYNGSAFTFNLQNPPMFIEYSVIPTNITERVIASPRTGSKSGGDYVVSYNTWSPYSWFIVTIRNKTTGEIYLEDGFGPGKGFSEYTKGTIKVLNRDDILVEFKGNQIMATATIWVKPLGNFENLQNITFQDCKFIDVPRNVIDRATATPTPTWVVKTTITTKVTTQPTIRPN
ncbi:MAG: hypothetical protein PHF57_09635 [Methanoregula sp.]|nr:hypothetical protein [Methanoregula sp.]